jgi:hypothetical protein
MPNMPHINSSTRDFKKSCWLCGSCWLKNKKPYFIKFQNILFIFYARLPLIALINLSTRYFNLFSKNKNFINVPCSCGKKSMRAMRGKNAKKNEALTKIFRMNRLFSKGAGLDGF